jgi:hypothetical protein
MTVRVSQLVRPLGFMAPTAAALNEAENALAAVGLTTEPRLRGCAWDDQVAISLAAPPAADPETRMRARP